MKKINAKHYAQALSRISGAPDLSVVLDNFFNLVRKNGQLSGLGEILSEYERIALEKKEGIAADLSVAASENKTIITEMIKRIKIPGIEKFKITARDDKDLLGGFKLRVRDILIDAGLKKKITDLKKSFN
ncbi:hypothetical protein EPN15_03580 [Patescibacteria group bacterium]|nr:MAG: hypothetical protein EPN15_03580 [Patescibacteria group bacterium]